MGVTTLSIGGMGGFELGLRDAGVEIEPCGFCEPERRAAEVLRREWPRAAQFRDSSEIIVADRSNRWSGHVKRRGIDLIFGKLRAGDIVLAGRGTRVAPKPGLGQRVARLIRQIQPAAGILEIESGVLRGDSGRRMQALLAHLAGWVPRVPADGWRSAGLVTPNPRLGDFAFGCSWRLLDLRCFGDASFGARGYKPQRRDRVYLVFQRGAAPDGQVLLDEEDFGGISEAIDLGREGASDAGVDEIDAGRGETGGGFEDVNAMSRLVPFVWRAGGFMAAPIVPRDTLPAISGDNVAFADERARAVRRLTPEEIELAFTYPNRFTATGLQRRTKGVRTVEIRDAPRYRMLGQHAVPPAIVEWIASRMDFSKI